MPSVPEIREEAAAKELTRLKRALAFYANPENWKIRGAELPSRAVPLTFGPEAVADGGKKARRALGWAE